MSGQRWKDYEEAADHGPMRIGLKIFGFVLVMGTLISIVGYAFGWFGEAAQVAKEEFGPRAALAKYEWLKDAAAQLEKKLADVKVYEGRIKEMDESYKDIARKDWPRDDREQRNVWSSETAGVKASYNTLAAEYNAQMAKFNWKFANVGDLPKGADDPLPREFKPYVTE